MANDGMNGWRHPRFGHIDAIGAGKRPKKVWKHFYNARECWERICQYPVATMRAEAEREAGIDRADSEALPDDRSGGAFRELLMRHHDEAYALVYMEEMASPETKWTRQTARRDRHNALTPGAVFLVIEPGEPSRVITAFRPCPPACSLRSEAALQRYAIRYFRRKGGMEFEQFVVDELQRVSTNVPVNGGELWWLASAVGFGRLLAGRPEVDTVLSSAEKVLGAVAVAVRDDLAEQLEWDHCLRRIEDGVSDDEVESVEDALLVAEELLAVADVIGAESACRAFCTQVEKLLKKPSPHWDLIFEMAQARHRTFGATDSWVHRLWAAAEKPVSQKELRTKLSALVGQGNEVLSHWTKRALDSLQIMRPIPVMGNPETEADARELRGTPPSDGKFHRMYIVDDTYPDGFEVTGHFITSDGLLWQLNASDEYAIVIVIAARSPLPDGDLATMMKLAESRTDVTVNFRTLIPPR